VPHASHPNAHHRSSFLNKLPQIICSYGIARGFDREAQAIELARGPPGGLCGDAIVSADRHPSLWQSAMLTRGAFFA
jgi:hypothetical protein